MESSFPQTSLDNRYEIQDLVGSGGAGKVYKAWDKSLRRFVAIKRFGSEFNPTSTSDEQAWREAMTLASIQHPNILTVFDFGVDELGPYVIMEFLEGQTLDKVIAQQGMMHQKDFRELAKQTLEALIAAHQIGLIHRDLKPQNIMVMQLASGAVQYKILDFGLAKIVLEPRAQTMIGEHSIVGSIFYVAPEQLSRKPVDARSDLYSMGCVYYYALSGHNAFAGESVTEIITNHIRHRMVPLHQRRADLPPPLCDWVHKCIQLQPEHRWQSASEALTALNRLPSAKTILIKSGPIAQPPEGAAEPLTGKVPVSKPSAKISVSKISVISGGILLAILLIAMIVQQARAPATKPASARTTSQSASARPPASKASLATPKASATTAKPASTSATARETVSARGEKAVASKPGQAPAAPARVSLGADQGTVGFEITAPMIWAHELATVESFVGREVAVRGRVRDVRSKGAELWIGFDSVERSKLAVVFPLDKDQREEVLRYARDHKNQMVCIQGVVERKDGQLLVRGKDVRQLDVLPPL